MDPATIPRQAPGYMVAEFDGEHMIYHSVEGRAVYLSESASLIWRLCDGRRSVEAITRLLHDAYPDAAELSKDVDSALGLLVEHRVVAML